MAPAALHAQAGICARACGTRKPAPGAKFNALLHCAARRVVKLLCVRVEQRKVQIRGIRVSTRKRVALERIDEALLLLGGPGGGAAKVHSQLTKLQDGLQPIERPLEIDVD